MSWIKNISSKKPEKQINEVFKNHIVPLSKRVKDKGPSYCDMRSVYETESYFQDPKNHGKEYLSFLNCATEEDLSEEFRSLWTKLGDTKLLPLAPELANIAFNAEEVNIEQSETISDFVYVMY